MHLSRPMLSNPRTASNAAGFRTTNPNKASPRSTAEIAKKNHWNSSLLPSRHPAAPPARFTPQQEANASAPESSTRLSRCSARKYRRRSVLTRALSDGLPSLPHAAAADHLGHLHARLQLVN